jgi:hypothetical protein
VLTAFEIPKVARLVCRVAPGYDTVDDPGDLPMRKGYLNLKSKCLLTVRYARIESKMQTGRRCDNA